MLGGTDYTVFTVQIQIVPSCLLAEGNLGRHAAGRRLKELVHGAIVRLADVPALDGLAEGGGMDRRQIAVEQPCPIEFAQNGHDATRAVHVFHVHVALGRRDLAQHGHLARQRVDIVHGEVDAALMGGGEDVQHGVGRPAHGDVQRHGVFERTLARR